MVVLVAENSVRLENSSGKDFLKKLESMKFTVCLVLTILSLAALNRRERMLLPMKRA